jgi:putative MATE family efflux protein
MVLLIGGQFVRMGNERLEKMQAETPDFFSSLFLLEAQEMELRRQKGNFTQGPILRPLLLFAMPVLAALLLQAMYGAVDLMVVGQFGTAADISGVSTGSQIMQIITNVLASFAMGTTILLGHRIGQGRGKEGGSIIGSSLLLFAAIAACLTVVLVLFAPQAAALMQAPEEAFDRTVVYVRICGAGTLILTAYNLISCIFRGLGDSRTPLLTVAIACVFNIAGDLILVGGFHLGCAGAAIATVAAQLVSVVISLLLIRKRGLPFTLTRKDFCWDRPIIGRTVQLGFPIALQDFLVGISFLIILAIVNSLGVLVSAGVGVAEKVCAFIMVVSSSFMQSMAAFVAQNYGAGNYKRALESLWIGISISFSIGVVMFYITFFHGDILAGIFSNDSEVIAAAWDYLKSYAFDCMLTAIFFCCTGFFNGIGLTKFVMLQGILGAFGVRVPVSYIMSLQSPVSLFHIGLATPASSLVQMILCFLLLAKIRRKWKGEGKL